MHVKRNQNIIYRNNRLASNAKYNYLEVVGRVGWRIPLHPGRWVDRLAVLLDILASRPDTMELCPGILAYLVDCRHHSRHADYTPAVADNRLDSQAVGHQDSQAVEHQDSRAVERQGIRVAGRLDSRAAGRLGSQAVAAAAHRDNHFALQIIKRRKKPRSNAGAIRAMMRYTGSSKKRKVHRKLSKSKQSVASKRI